MGQPVAMAVPFALDSTGAVAQNVSADSQLNDRITALASTIPGTRPMATRFGVSTQPLLFAPGDSMALNEIHNDITVQLSIYEPGAQLNSITPITNTSSTGIAGIVCTASRKDSAATASVTTTRVKIGVGGTVTDYASTTTG